MYIIITNFIRSKIFIIFITIFIVNSFNCSSAKKTVRSSDTYQTVGYNWYLKTLDDIVVPFTNFKEKVVFLNIWATWCPPCVKEMPSIQQLYNNTNKHEVAFVIASSERKDKIKQFLVDHQINLPVYIVATTLPRQFQNNLIPRTYIIDRFGRIVYQHTGQANWNTKEINEFLRFLTNVEVTNR